VTVALGVLAALSDCGLGTPATPGVPQSSNEALVSLQGLIIDGLVYPSDQFQVVAPDRCDAPHWHAHREVASIGTLALLDSVACHDGYQFQTRTDPDPAGCGFGRVSEVRRVDAFVDAECWRRWDSFY
jgi:hypothetical protein